MTNIEKLQRIWSLLEDMEQDLSEYLKDLQARDPESCDLIGALDNALDICRTEKAVAADNLDAAEREEAEADAAYWAEEDARATREYWREVL